MDDLSLPEVRRLVDAANALHRQGDASGGAAGSDGRRAEQRLDDLFSTSHTLAVYSTLRASPTIMSSRPLGASGRTA
jgi:hypothetical protein